MKKSKLTEFIESIIAIIALILLVAIPALILLFIYSKLNIGVSFKPSEYPTGVFIREWESTMIIYFVLPICLFYYILINRWISRGSKKIAKENESEEVNDKIE